MAISLQDGLKAFLKNQAGISALISGRIYPMVLKQGSALPAIVYQRISNSKTKTVNGRGIFAKARVQISCYGASYQDAENLANQVDLSLDGYRGLFVNTSGNIMIQSIFIEGRRDLTNSDVKFSIIALDAIIMYNQ